MDLRNLQPEALEANLKGLWCRERKALVTFLLHLAEFERRRLYRKGGYSSLWQYCRTELQMSESQAFYRTRAARLFRQLPVAAQYVEDGRLCVTTIVRLRDVLTQDNALQLLDQAVGMTRYQIRKLVATLAPSPAPVAAIVRALPSPVMAPTASSESAAPASPQQASSTLAPPTLVALPRALPADAVPMNAEQFRIHFTADKEFLEKLERATNALSHSIPDRDMRKVIERALDAILVAESKRHEPGAAKASGTRAKAPREGSRYIPADLVRQVWARDNHCCSFRTKSGVCGSKHQLEIDHILAVALGGKTELDNLRLVCREHNQMAARETFGDEFVESKIEEARSRTPVNADVAATRKERATLF